MKQNITQEQWNEINNEQKRRFVGEEEYLRLEKFIQEFSDIGITIRNSADKQVFPFSLPDIGTMIEFLDWEWTDLVNVGDHGCEVVIPDNDKLCDALWGACKEKLSKV